MRTIFREELVRHAENQIKGFSKVGPREAEALLSELNLNEVDGNAVEPIIVPADAPQPSSFAYEDYPDENTGTPFLLAHHQKELERHGVKFGRNGFNMYDIHSKRKTYNITARSGQRYSGTSDGCAAPFGLMASSAGKHSRVAYMHKQNEAQKQNYCDKHPDQHQGKNIPSSADQITYSGAHKGESVMALLGAYAYNNYPLMLDLTDGVTHHLLQMRDDELFVWTDLTSAQAYFKQAELLKSLPTLLTDCKLQLEAIPEELQVPLKKMRTLRTVSGLGEQLSSVVPCLPPSERLSGANDIINTWLSAAEADAPLLLSSDVDAPDMFA